MGNSPLRAHADTLVNMKKTVDQWKSASLKLPIEFRDMSDRLTHLAPLLKDTGMHAPEDKECLAAIDAKIRAVYGRMLQLHPQATHSYNHQKTGKVSLNWRKQTDNNPKLKNLLREFLVACDMWMESAHMKGHKAGAAGVGATARAQSMKEKKVFADGSLHELIAHHDVQGCYAMIQANPACINETNVNRMTPLHTAAFFNLQPIVEYLLQCKVNVNLKDRFKNTAMDVACMWDYANVVAVLAKQTSSMNLHTIVSTDSPQVRSLTWIKQNNPYFKDLINHANSVSNYKGYYPIHTAVHHGNVAVLNVLKDVVDPNIKNSEGKTPLHIAVEGDNANVLAVLSAWANVDFDASDAKGNTPLMLGVVFASAESVTNIAKRCNPTATNHKGQSSTHFLVHRETADPQIVNVLVSHGIDITAKDNSGQTVLHSSVLVDNPACIESLLPHLQGKMDVADNDGHTPAHYAVATNQVTTLRRLIQCGSNVNAVNNKGETMAHMVTAPAMLDMLVAEFGMSVHMADQSGETPVFKALRRGDKDSVGAIVRHGGKMLMTSTGGVTPFMAAVQGNDIDMVKLVHQTTLAEAGNNAASHNQYLQYTNSAGQSAMSLVQSPSILTLLTAQYGYTPNNEAMKVAVRGGNVATMQNMCTAGGLVMCAQVQGEKNLLQVAVETGNVDMVNAVIKQARLESSTPHNVTALASSGLMVANSVSVMEALVVHCGVSVSQPIQGLTPVSLAAAKGNAETVRFLLTKGAKVTTVNADGGTCWLEAVKGGNADVMKIVHSASLAECGNDKSKHQAFLKRCNAEGQSAISYVTTPQQMQTLQQCGFNVNEVDKDGKSCLFGACRAGNVVLAKTLMQQGCRAAITARDGTTPFSQAAMGGSVECMDAVAGQAYNVELNKNAEQYRGYIQFANPENGQNALHFVAQTKELNADNKTDPVIVNLVKSKGFTPGAQDKFKNTPLHLACAVGNHQAATALLRLGGGALSSAVSLNGTTVLMDAARGGSTECLKLVTDALQQPVQGKTPTPAEYRAKLTARNARGHDCIMVAAIAGGSALAAIGFLTAHFAEHGLDAGQISRECVDLNGHSAMHLAAESGNITGVQTLIAQGLSVCSRAETTGNTVLMMAVKSGKTAMIDCIGSAVLAEFNGDMKQYQAHCVAVNADGDNALHVACKGKTDQAVLSKLMSMGFTAGTTNAHGMNAMQLACAAGNVSAIQALAASGNVNLMARDASGETLLFAAAESGNAEAVQALLHAVQQQAGPQGTKNFLETTNKSGETAMFAAVKGGDGSANVVSALAAAGANLAHHDASGNNLAHAAAANDCDEVLAMLPALAGQHGVSLNEANKAGQTPLHVAASADNGGAMDKLLQAGADMTIRNAVTNDTVQQEAKKNHATHAKDIITNAKLATAGAGLGELQIGLSWSDYNDLDLSCVTPSGERIYYQHRTGKCGGRLDIDQNFNPTEPDPVEHMFWKKNPPAGTYRVFSVFFNCHTFTIRNDKQKKKIGCALPCPFDVVVKHNSQDLMTTRSIHSVSGSIQFDQKDNGEQPFLQMEKIAEGKKAKNVTDPAYVCACIFDFHPTTGVTNLRAGSACCTMEEDTYFDRKAKEREEEKRRKAAAMTESELAMQDGRGAVPKAPPPPPMPMAAGGPAPPKPPPPPQSSAGGIAGAQAAMAADNADFYA